MTKFTLQYLKLLLHYNYKWAIVIEKLLPLQGGGSKATLLAKLGRLGLMPHLESLMRSIGT